MRIAVGVALFVLGGCAASPPGVELVHVTKRPPTAGPHFLVVVAHPDDEIAFAGTVYKSSTFLEGACDVAVLTNGEGGFKYSTLAESIYDLPLTLEDVGREHLPAIRQGELVESCRLLGVRDIYFFEERDHRYTQDPEEVLAPDAGVWDLDGIARGLGWILEEGGYDYVLTLTPTAETHGHHQAAAILVLRAVRDMPAARRPLCLAGSTAAADDPVSDFRGREKYPITALDYRSGPFVFDRRQNFGHRGRLDYRVLVNLAIAAHRSQGTMQLLMNEGDEERYRLYAGQRKDAVEDVTKLFKALGGVQFSSRVYGETAGTNADDR